MIYLQVPELALSCNYFQSMRHFNVLIRSEPPFGAGRANGVTIFVHMPRHARTPRASRRGA
jgi:hypothetical protein